MAADSDECRSVSNYYFIRQARQKGVWNRDYVKTDFISKLFIRISLLYIRLDRLLQAVTMAKKIIHWNFQR